MKKSIITSIIALAISLATALDASAQSKIGTVDMKKCFNGYYKTKDAEANMNELRTQVKKDLDERVEKFKQLNGEISKLEEEVKSPALAKEKIEEKKKLHEEKVGEARLMMRELEQFRGEKEKQLADQTLRMRNGIVDEIKAVIKTKVETDAYDIVFDTSGETANSVPAVIYAKSAYDFTDEIVKTMNKNKPATSEKTPANDQKPAADKKP